MNRVLEPMANGRDIEWSAGSDLSVSPNLVPIVLADRWSVQRMVPGIGRVSIGGEHGGQG